MQDIGENIYTVPDIIKEIRDATTRARLQVLPYELHFKQPSPEAIKCGESVVILTAKNF